MDKYYTIQQSHVKFEKSFYDLGLHDKLKIIIPLLEEEFTWLSYERIVKAILQHSSKELKNEYPLPGIRKLSKAAHNADIQHIQAIQYSISETEK